MVGNEAWRLQLLTDLDELPDYEDGWGYGGQPKAPPVDAEGNPIFYALPKDLGRRQERWRAVALGAGNDGRMEARSLRNDERMIRARFLESQFGVQTLAQFGIVSAAANRSRQRRKTIKTGIWAIDTLGEDETIARLATGIKRFKLPDDQNYIKLYQQVVDETPTGKSHTNRANLDALRNLAQLFENRRQYPRAAEYWRKAVERSTGDQRATSSNGGSIKSSATGASSKP